MPLSFLVDFDSVIGAALHGAGGKSRPVVFDTAGRGAHNARIGESCQRARDSAQIKSPARAGLSTVWTNPSWG
jgi:hypothetical protein